MEVGTLDAILSLHKLLPQQVAELTKMFETVNVSVVNHSPIVCDFCASSHANGDYMGNMFSPSSSSHE